MGSPSSRSSQVLALALLVALIVGSSGLAGCLQVLRPAGQPGAWAEEFLQASTYPRLLVEVDHEAGAAPEPQTLQKMERIFGDRLNKPDGIDLEVSGGVDGKGRGAKYSFAEIRALEDNHRDHHKGGDRAVLYVLFLDGGSDQDTDGGRVLGAVYSGSSVVIFKDNLRATYERCNQQTPILGCPTPFRTLEDAVTTHEIGHILGLVNLGVPMAHDREDPNSTGHSVYEDSVMHYAVRTGNILNFLIGDRVPTEFDQYDIQDLRNAGGR